MVELQLIIPTDPMIRGSCKELYDDGLKTSGFYLINPGGAPEFTVFCDMNTNVVNRPGNGWTVILRRLDSSLPSFNRSWEEYRNGFGCLNDSFWLGLERIRYVVSHNLPGCSNTTHQLYVGMEQYHLFNPTMPYNWAVYNFFSIGDESANYDLNIDNVGGGSSYDTLSKAGDALKIHSGVEFSTYDHDNDISTGHCAETGGGGWWYRNCLDSHLTGMFYDQGYMPPPAYDGIIWEGTTSDHDSLIRAVMAVRPVCND